MIAVILKAARRRSAMSHVAPVRTVAQLGLLCGISLAAPVAAQQVYVANLTAKSGTQWTGVATFATAPDGNVEGGLCMVRTEWVDHPAFPRKVLRIPITGHSEADRLTLRFPQTPDGPSLEGSSATLRRLTEATSNLVPAGSWQFGEDEFEPKLVHGSREARLFTLTNDSTLVAQLTQLTSARLDQVAIYKSRKDEQDFKPSQIDIGAYDGLAREQVRAFERQYLFADLYSKEVVMVVASTGQIAKVQQFLDGLGDGARVLNGELADCPPVAAQLVVTVPAGLELWYARRLQTSGLVQAAYPEVQGRDPAFSEIYLFTTAALAPVLRNRGTSSGEKYQAIWTAFEDALRRFAQGRQSNFAPVGRVVTITGAAGPMFRAEITGRALAVCRSNRWEKIVVNAAALSFDATTGRASLSVNFSDGFYGLGATLPPPARMADNRIPDTDLDTLQRIFVGATQAGAAHHDIRC